MSANPRAFDDLRRRAYWWTYRHALSARNLHNYLSREAGVWQTQNPGEGLTDAEARQLVYSITKWTIERYRPTRLPTGAKDRRECRTDRILTRRAEFEARGDRATCRAIAGVSKTSKSTVQRTFAGLAERGESDAVYDALGKRARLLHSAVIYLPPGQTRTYDLDQIATILIPGETSQTASARSMRRRRIEDAFVELAAAGYVRYRRKVGRIAVIRGDLDERAWTAALRRDPTPLNAEDLDPELLYGPTFRSPEARDILTLYKTSGIRYITAATIRDLVFSFGQFDAPETAISTILKGWTPYGTIEAVAKYLKSSSQFTRMSVHDVERCRVVSELLLDAERFWSDDELGDIRDVLTPCGYVERVAQFPEHARRLEFLSIALQSSDGLLALNRLADAERRRKWRWRPELPHADNLRAAGIEPPPVALAAEGPGDDYDEPVDDYDPYTAYERRLGL